MSYPDAIFGTFCVIIGFVIGMFVATQRSIKIGTGYARSWKRLRRKNFYRIIKIVEHCSGTRAVVEDYLWSAEPFMIFLPKENAGDFKKDHIIQRVRKKTGRGWHLHNYGEDPKVAA